MFTPAWDRCKGDTLKSPHSMGMAGLGKQVHKALGSVVDTVTELTSTLHKNASNNMTSPIPKHTSMHMEEETSDNNDVAIVIGANDTESTEEERSGSVIAIGDINNSGSSKLQSKQAKDRHNTFTDFSSTGELDIRDQYPRSGWHDVHTSLNGSAARDVANHFVERWNHHRL